MAGVPVQYLDRDIHDRQTQQHAVKPPNRDVKRVFNAHAANPRALRPFRRRSARTPAFQPTAYASL